MLNENFDAIDDINEFTEQSLLALNDERPRNEGGQPPEASAFAGDDIDFPIPEITPVQQDDHDQFGQQPELQPPEEESFPDYTETTGDGEVSEATAPPQADEAADTAPVERPEDETQQPGDTDGTELLGLDEEQIEPPVEDPATGHPADPSTADAEPQSLQTPQEPQTPPDYFDIPDFEGLGFDAGEPMDDEAPHPATVQPVALGAGEAEPAMPPGGDSHVYPGNPGASGRQSGPLPTGDFTSREYQPSFGSGVGSGNVRESQDTEEDYPDMDHQGLRDMAQEVLTPLFQETNQVFVSHLNDEMTVQNELTRAGRYFG